jgi:hypothetical protein
MITVEVDATGGVGNDKGLVAGVESGKGFVGRIEESRGLAGRVATARECEDKFSSIFISFSDAPGATTVVGPA